MTASNKIHLRHLIVLSFNSLRINVNNVALIFFEVPKSPVKQYVLNHF